jgi:hypothetical protein
VRQWAREALRVALVQQGAERNLTPPDQTVARSPGLHLGAVREATRAR